MHDPSVNHSFICLFSEFIVICRVNKTGGCKDLTYSARDQIDPYLGTDRTLTGHRALGALDGQGDALERECGA